MGFTVVFDETGMKKLTRGVVTRIRKDLLDEMNIQSRSLTNFVITRHLTGETTEDRLAVRSGMLRRTTRAKKAVIKKDDIIGGVLFGVKYAVAHVGRKGSVFKIRRTSSLGKS